MRLIWMCYYRVFLRREGVLGIGHLVVFLFHHCTHYYSSSVRYCEDRFHIHLRLLAVSASYAVDDIGGGARDL